MIESHPSRREFLQAATAGLATVVANSAGDLCTAADAKPIEIIDTHTHFYDPTRPHGIPWPDKKNKLLYRTVLPADFLTVAKPHGVTRTVVVEASPWLEDNQWLLDLAAKEQSLSGIVGHLDPGDEEFEKNLRRFAMNPHYRGIRVNHGLLKKGLSEYRFKRDLALLAEHDLELDVNGGPDMPVDVATIAKAIPALRIVINHVANVKIDGKAPPESWQAGMQAAAAHRNVFCKVSALVEGATQRDADMNVPDNVEFYRPVLDTVWKLFGDDRVIYGSNWPVCERAAPYATVFKIVNEYFRGRGADAADKYFRRNALAAYKWVARS